MGLISWIVLECIPAKLHSDDTRSLSLTLNDLHVMWPLSRSQRESWNTYVRSPHTDV